MTRRELLQVFAGIGGGSYPAIKMDAENTVSLSVEQPTVKVRGIPAQRCGVCDYEMAWERQYDNPDEQRVFCANQACVQYGKRTRPVVLTHILAYEEK